MSKLKYSLDRLYVSYLVNTTRKEVPMIEVRIDPVVALHDVYPAFDI